MSPLSSLLPLPSLLPPLPSTHPAVTPSPGGASRARRRRAAAVLALSTVAAGGACGDASDAQRVRLGARDAKAATPRRLAPPIGVTLPGVAPTPGGYRVLAGAAGAAGATAAGAVPGPSSGLVTGTVTLLGTAPPDTTVTPDSAAARVCGQRLVDRTMQRRGDRVAGVVVWLTDVRAGKPLPLQRRYEVTLERCALTPRAFPALVGGTLNVHGRDPLDARLHFVRWPGGEALLLAPLTDAGQVIPDERLLASAGTLEVRGERHPWLRAWVLAFDHPYFAATDADGAFALADVPPGSYRLVAWHERLGRVERQVVVRGGETTGVGVEMGGGETGAAEGGRGEGAEPVTIERVAP